MSKPVATVVISTKNRRDDLATALSSVLRQTIPLAILVVDDGSTDGTSEMIQRDFPDVGLVTCRESRGYIVRRNEAANLAETPYLVSIDDDAVLTHPQTIELTLAEFSHPRIAAVAIPFIDVRYSQEVRQRATEANSIEIAHAFVGTAHALRREAFLAVGGYREALVHQGEEGDLALRWLDRGWVVRRGSAPPLEHRESPRRDWRRMDFYGRRNDFLLESWNAPLSVLPGRWVRVALGGMAHAWKTRRFVHNTAGLLVGVRDSWRYRSIRQPVSHATYQLFRRLKTSRSPINLESLGWES